MLKDIIQKSLTEAMETEIIISLWGTKNPKKTGPRRLWNSFIKSELEYSPFVSPFNANDEIIKCDRLIKDKCLKNIYVYEVIDKIDKELTNIIL